MVIARMPTQFSVVKDQLDSAVLIYGYVCFFHLGQLSRQSSGGLSRQLSRQSSGPSTKAYSREFLLSCSTSPTSWKFPETLQRILDGDDDDSKSIILKQVYMNYSIK